MIALCCDSCKKQFSIQVKLAGQLVTCPSCGHVWLVPSAVTDPVHSPRSVSAATQADSSPGQDQATQPPPPAEATQVYNPGQTGHDSSLTNFLAPPQADDELGRLGGFRILRILGQGGMGVVYLGEDPKLGRKVAIKAMLPHMAQDYSAQQRFLQEARAAAALEHDHIVPIFHVGEEGGVSFMVMPFLKGEPLDRRLQRDQKLPITEVLRLGREIAGGLAAAHATGLIHRDIKPANVWLEEPGQRAKILDFGLARPAVRDAGLTQEGAIAGTPAYMSPEQGRGEPLDHRCDLWSLGVLLYRALTGQQPFTGNDSLSTLVAVVQHQPPPPAQLDATVPPGLSDLVMKLLAKDPAQRFASAQEVVEALQELAEKREEVLAARPPRRRAPLVMALAAVLVAAGVAVLGAASGLIWPPPEETPPGAKSPGPGADGSNGPGDNQGTGDGKDTKDHQDLKETKGGADGKNMGDPKTKSGKEKKGNTGKEPLPKKYKHPLGMEFVLVPKGKSWLGGGGGIPGTKEVNMSRDFYLGAYEVTHEEWHKVMGNNPSHYTRGGFKSADVKHIKEDDLKRFPVENISWTDAQTFVAKLNERDKQVGWVYRLPKEAEWEYACRGGPLTSKAESAFDYYFDKPVNHATAALANFHFHLKRPTKVGQYPPNRLGLHDMHGNVAEWCLDDSKSAPSGEIPRISRGGDWTAKNCAAGHRALHSAVSRHNYRGLRVARVHAAK